MSARFSSVIVFGVLLVRAVSCPSASAQQVIYYRSLPDIGQATFDHNGNPVVRMNASICRQRPDLCEFVRAHEIAHHRRGHLHGNVNVRQAEVEADRWAAMHASPRAVRAAAQFFGSGYGGTRQNGTSRQRLATVNQAVAQRARIAKEAQAKAARARAIAQARLIQSRATETRAIQTRSASRSPTRTAVLATSAQGTTVRLVLYPQ